ncbi:MAG TPA: DNA-3-methyladenine glycosylase [Gammaproteobacteria bacterium]|jgi:DNA-3-methyladenine glycosylase|nr:DNA-3-methyladenine glycosylase [Gammaproteobacteria bacterium]
MRLRRLRRKELPTATLALARFLIGKTLVRDLPRGRIMGRIVETEAYLPYDAACHAFKGATPRNGSLFLEHGHAYVYFIYGSHFMLNICSEKAGVGAGVLLRAVEPLQGIELMYRHRGRMPLRDLARGPGRLAAAFKVDMHLDGMDVTASGPLWLGTAVQPVAAVGRSVRIGISRDAHRPWRFYERGNPYVSGPGILRA